MNRKWSIVLSITGVMALTANYCFAEQHAKTPHDSFKASAQITPKRTSHVLEPTRVLTHIFDNLNYQPETKLAKKEFQEWREYKDKLRSLAAVHFTDTIQVGVDRVKAGPSKVSKGEIVDVNSHLAPKSSGTTSRGIGLQMRVKLD